MSSGLLIGLMEDEGQGDGEARTGFGSNPLRNCNWRGNRQSSCNVVVVRSAACSATVMAKRAVTEQGRGGPYRQEMSATGAAKDYNPSTGALSRTVTLSNKCAHQLACTRACAERRISVEPLTDKPVPHVQPQTVLTNSLVFACRTWLPVLTTRAHSICRADPYRCSSVKA